MTRLFRFVLQAITVAACLQTANAQTPAEHIAEIRIHGNVRITDEDVQTIAGLAIGGPAGEKDLADARQRLERSGKFESVEIRKRYRSIDDTDNAAIVLIVHEHPEGEGSALTRPLRRLTSQRLFGPAFNYRDGYGLAYGLRATSQDLLGLGERWSVPLTWSGARSAFAEVERPFKTGPITGLQARFGINSEINPHFLERDRRVKGSIIATRAFSRIRLATETTGARIRFGAIEERLWTSGGSVTIDTRGNPAFPSNAIYVNGGWRALWSGGRPVTGVAVGDLRGYWRAERRTVLAGRLRYEGANRRLPDYERLLIGGAASLRGKRFGILDGDRTLAATAEVRRILGSPFGFVQSGATVFFDAAKAFDAGQSPSAVAWERSAGIGFFATAPFIKINIHAGKPLDGGRVRVHLSFGFTF